MPVLVTVVQSRMLYGLDASVLHVYRVALLSQHVSLRCAQPMLDR